jgi:hypothetical protein
VRGELLPDERVIHIVGEGSPDHVIRRALSTLAPLLLGSHDG